MPNQYEQIDRVRNKLEPAIISFRELHGIFREFHAQDLRDFVSSYTGRHNAPASAQRIMQLLRKAGELDYEVVSRAQSLYQFVPDGTTEFFGSALHVARGQSNDGYSY